MVHVFFCSQFFHHIKCKELENNSLRALRLRGETLYALKLTTTLPRISPFKISSIFGLNSSNEHSVTRSPDRSSFQSVDSFSQARTRVFIGISTESTPSRLTPLRIKGYTLTARS